MSLDLSKLEKRIELPGGILRARCPACAENGQDKTGEHLRIYPDGRYGCCVHPKDREHRKRIFALAGERRMTQSIQVRVAPSGNSGSVQAGVLGRLGRVFGSPAQSNVEKPWDGWDGVNEVETKSVEAGTLGTGKTEKAEKIELISGTLGTPQYSYTCGENNREIDGTRRTHIRIGFREAVPSVPGGNQGVVVQPAEDGGARLPFFTADGTLSIPFDSPERYHWWKGGQSIAETRSELRAGVADKERMSYAGEF